MPEVSDKIVLMKTSDILPYDNNPRLNDEAVDAVANSIKTFGFRNPIIVDKNNVIIAGHTRLLASKKLGLERVPVIVVTDLTDDEIKALRLADNKTAEIAKWDMGKLSVELANINMDMLQFGFEDLINKLEKEVKEDDFDENEELPENPYAKKGDIFLLGNNRLMCGDSTDEETVNKLMDGKQADLVFTDPPYNVDISNADGLKIQNDNMKDSDFYNFLLKAFKNLFNHTKPGGSIYCFHADSEGLNFRKAFKEAGFKLAECLIWVKNSLVLSRQDYHWRHEPCLYGWKEGASHYFIDDRTQDTIWEYNKPKANDLHPTMKPLELVGRAIKNSSKQKEIVLDLFGGSGSTLIAANQINRNAYLMELDERYVDVIVKRYLRNVGTFEGCFLIRDGEKIPLEGIKDYQVLNDNGFLE